MPGLTSVWNLDVLQLLMRCRQQVAEELGVDCHQLEVSMGMSADYEHAVSNVSFLLHPVLLPDWFLPRPVAQLVERWTPGGESPGSRRSGARYIKLLIGMARLVGAAAAS